MQTQNLGYPRIGSQYELRKASELYWSGSITVDQLLDTGKNIRRQNWSLQKKAVINFIPSNDYFFYDLVLDASLMVSAIPNRHYQLIKNSQLSEINLLFAMARGYQKKGRTLPLWK
ncbi:hypothetical protein [Anditalea andensis]|uniref:Cobalamin-independent methionine synthase MetE N-terminal domain-containing protein n=1 Tax=Anditalea andensis TaxID=1048983 RepID=A0A074KUI1_9BACT|nr:hypothetical protein [Anditalea andensis]KEO71940.1 hypothetical protein EL17_20705 [Anditalea andensis]